MRLREVEEGGHRHVGDDSQEEFGFEVGEIINRCFCFLKLATLDSHVNRDARPLLSVLLVRHLEDWSDVDGLQNQRCSDRKVEDGFDLIGRSRTVVR